MSLTRGTHRLMTTATCGQHITPPHHLPALTTTRRPGKSRPPPPSLSRGQRRHLHWPAAIEGTVQAAQDSLIALHATVGLPWYLAIPAAALSVNLFIRLPLQVYSRRAILQQSALLPFLQAWKHRHTAMLDQKTAQRQFRKTSRRIFSERGCQGWKQWATAFAIPAWLVFPEAVRRMSGMEGGLLSWLSGGPEAAAQPESALAALPDGSGLVEAAGSAVQTAVSGAEPSLATGGALWFQDLTAADPYLVLPVALGALMIYNIMPPDAAKRRLLFNLRPDPAQLANPQGRFRLRMQRALVWTSGGFVFITMQLPAGMVLYWASASLFSALNHLALDYAMPVPKNTSTICAKREVDDPVGATVSRSQ